jgi:CheY-like chemotaxis protein
MAETQSLLSASLPRAARVAVGTIPDAAVVSGDPVQLQQVIINLCNNAVQAMDGPCTVELTIDVHAIIELRQLSQGYLAPGGYVRTTVRDSGRGMDAAAQERLFEPFFTTRLNGNGLGLATVREIVRGHGGAINVSSRLGEGSVFEIWLPQAARPTAPRDDTAPIQGSGTIQGNGETVMVVDGDHARLLHDEEIVAALGYEPVGFVEPEQAVRTCREAPGRFDAVLIGHVVPTAQALALTAELRHVAPKLPILLAASAGELGADVLATAGISEVVTKPLVSAELAAALSRWLPK